LFRCRTINAGIEKPLKKILLRFQPPLFYKNIKRLLYSHAHLDHVSGLIINSPADVANSLCSSKCMDMMENHYFNETWANFVTKAKVSSKKIPFPNT
jgi:3',5'-cyclic-nucleotide phosphodiesterase